MPDPRLEHLKSLLRKRAVQIGEPGEFLLSSGQRSDIYVDGRLLTLSSEGAEAVAELLWEKIASLQPDAVGGMSLGADPIVGAILHHAAKAGRKDLAGFLVRKEPKGHGTKKQVEGPRPEKETPRVVVVEDTASTGGSCLKAATAVRREWDAEVLGAFVIVDRESGAADAFAGEGIPFHALLTLDELRG